MDPIIIDPVKALGSVAGIVATTIALVHIIKRQCGDIPYVKQIPVFVYAWIVAAALTWVSHAVLHAIEGELGILMVQSVLSTVLAAGTIELWRSGTKPIENTRVARLARLRRREDGA